MAKELGQTSDPAELVPGAPGAVSATATAMRAYGNALHQAATGLQRIDTTEGWSGQAADNFRSVFHGQPSKWLAAGDCFHKAATALDNYANTLTWAQGQAGDAVRQWNTATTATNQAKAQHQQAEQQAGHSLPSAIRAKQDARLRRRRWSGRAVSSRPPVTRPTRQWVQPATKPRRSRVFSARWGTSSRMPVLTWKTLPDTWSTASRPSAMP